MRASGSPTVKFELVYVFEIRLNGGDPMILILTLLNENKPLLLPCLVELSQLIELEGKPKKDGMETPLSTIR